jgi:para-aminobenzoate synthetase component 1
MWSEKTSPERLQSLAHALRALPLSPMRGRGLAFLKSGPQGACWLRDPLATVTYTNGCAIAETGQASTHLKARGFEILDAMLETWREVPNAFLAGYLSYDLSAELEDLGPSPAETFEFPRFHFGLYNRSSEPVAPSFHRSPEGESVELAPGELISRPDQAHFEASVERIVKTIHAGDIFQTNLCRSIETLFEPGAERELFERLRRISPARYEAFFDIGPGRAVMSISPETFLTIRHGVVESHPIKGTRPRGRDASEDAALSAELQSSEKDRAELAMIVDVVRNDLARVCETGTVKVEKHAELMTIPTVHHLYSRVTGRLRQGNTPVDLLRASFPPASISGAPKIEAMRVAMREEGQLRGPCMGAIGWISLDGDMELSVAIRTAFSSDGRVRYYAGCGITSESDPVAEFEESAHKSAAFLRALGLRP